MSKRNIFGIWMGSALFCCAMCVPVLRSQSTSAELQGVIRDPSGAVIPNASISVSNVATGIVRTTVSNDVGIFRVPDLVPSVYEVTVSAAGFATRRLTNIELTVGAQQVLNVALTTAGVSTTVEVSSAAPAIELASAALTGVEDSRTTRELPLNGRDWTQLATLQPGVSLIRTQNTLNGSTSNRGSRGFGTEVSIGGGRPTQNNYFLDGISQNDYTNGVPGSVLGLALGVDAIQEFSVVTNNYNATYGGTSGGVVNAVTRSGTNTFHGDIFEFLRNDQLDARNFFDPPQKPPFRRNQFGVAAGGPIHKDKTFIFGNYEGLRQAQSITSIATVPSVAARTGNLSTGHVTVSPVITPFLALWHLPNGPILPPGDTAQYIFAARTPSSQNTGSLRVDHLISAKDNVAVTYSVDDGSTQVPDSLNTIFADSTLRRNTVAINETHILNSQMANVFRAGMNRVVTNALSTSPGANPAAGDLSLGVLPGRAAPYLSVGSGITDFAGGLNGLATTNFWYTNFQFYDDFSVQKGKHAIKAGPEFIRYRYNTQVASTPNAQYSFNSLADFLTNQKVTQFFADVSYNGGQAHLSGTGFPERGFRQSVFGAYLQDDFRARTNLTLNLGLRYEMATLPGEVNGLLANLRDIYSTNLNVGQPLFENPSYRNFEPRIGLAWDPFHNGKTSIRAGFGLFDVLPLIYEVSMLEGYSGPFSALFTLINPPAGSFPSGGYNAILNTDPNKLPVREPSLEYNPRRNYVMQWNTSIQRSLAPSLALTVAYAGSHGVHMATIFNDVDIVPPTRTAQGYQWPLPVGSGTRLNPNVGSIRQLTRGGTSVYHSLQTRLQKKFSRGFQLQGSFTWQKSIDDSSSSVFPTQFQNATTILSIDRRLNRGPSDFNVGRVAVIDGLWELPKMKSAPGAVRALANGWELGAIFQAADGVPFTPLISGDAVGENSSGSYDVPNRVVGPACSRLTNPGNLNPYINLNCYSFPPPGLLGNAGRNSLIGPGLVNLDFSAIRNFRLPFLSEAVRLQFRAEAFDVMNHPNFQIPSRSLYNVRGTPVSTAGLITATIPNMQREVQVALRLIW